MTTIDKLDMNIHVEYARRTNVVEQANQEYHLDQAASIPAQLRIPDFYPRASELDLLLGVRIVQNPWAFFFPPPSFQFQRRPPFGFSKVAPSLGSFEDLEKVEETLEDEKEASTADEKAQKGKLKKCLDQIKQINGWMGFIVGRLGQFLQA